MTRHRWIPFLVLVALAACRSANPDRPAESRWRRPPAAAPERAGDEEATGLPEAEPVEAGMGFDLRQAGAVPIVARVGAQTIDVGELLATWMQVNSREVTEVLEKLVSAELVEIEAGRIGMRLDQELVEGEYEAALRDLENGVQSANPGLSLEAWIAGALGLDPDEYKAWVRLDVERRLLAERVVRAYVMAHERALIRVCITETREEIERALADLRGGRSFEEVVAAYSVEEDGRMPPILRTESPLSRLAFATEVGDVGGPMQDGEQGRWMIVNVVSIEPARDAHWDVVGAEVESSLAQEAIQDPEYWQWKAEMSRRYEVDLEPFFDLVAGAE